MMVSHCYGVDHEHVGKMICRQDMHWVPNVQRQVVVCSITSKLKVKKKLSRNRPWRPIGL
jgi:hypothetical protein